jgi:hypothetical protein
MSAARANGHRHIAVCLLGRDSASLSLIDTAGTAVQSTTTTISRESLSLADWLNTAFGGADVRPEVLCLIGSRGKLDAFADRLGQALSIPVLATHDAQLALARGAAFSDASSVHDLSAAQSFRWATHARTIVVLAGVAAATLFTLSSADAPNPLASSALPQPTSTSPTRPGDTPAGPMALPPPPAEPFVPPKQAAPAPESWAAAATTDVAAPQTISTAVPDGADAPPPVQHIPDAQPAAVLGPAPTPTVETSPSMASMPPPPPPDPLADALSPLFSGLP